MAAVTLTTIAIGAAIGAGVGAVATYASGGRGDAIWKGALTGAVGGAVTGGVGSWATGALGGTVGGALAGAAGGVTAGALGTALSGGTGQDYLKNMFTGGAGGAVLGGAGGYLSGGEAAAGTPSGLEAATQEAGSGLAQGGTGVDTGGAMGLGTGTGATGIEASVSGAPTAAPAATPVTSPLADTVSSIDTGGAMAGGGSTVAPSLETTTTPSLANLGQQGQSQANLSMQNLGLTPAGEGTTMAPIEGASMAPATQAGNQSPTGFWDNFLGGSKTTKGTGMGLEDYLKMQGKAQLLGGGIKALGALATAPESQANKQALMDLYNQQNEQNQFYANKLQQTYQNPQAYLSSPEAQATRSAALQKLVAQNAAAGRRTAGSALQNQLMMNQLQNLGAYRQGMPRPQYGTAAQVYQNAAQYSPTADIFGGVSSMATPLSLYSLFG